MNLVSPIIINSEQAKSAEHDIDIHTILDGCDDILSNLNGINIIHREFSETINLIDNNALSINGYSPLAKKTDDCDSQIIVTMRAIENIVNDTIDAAISEYNNLQNKYNSEFAQEMAERMRRESFEN